MSFVGMLYTFPSSALTASGVSVHLWHDMLDSWVNYMNISAWGFGVARSNSDGQCESLCDVERVTGKTPTSFLYMYNV